MLRSYSHSNLLQLLEERVVDSIASSPVERQANKSLAKPMHSSLGMGACLLRELATLVILACVAGLSLGVSGDDGVL